jgi:hypothetical protein
MDEKKTIGFLTDLDGKKIRELKEGDRVQSGASISAFRDKKLREAAAEKAGDKQEWNLEHFFKGHIPEIRELMKSLSVFERAFLFSIATYVGYEDCCLKYDNGVCLDFEAMVDISGMSRGKTSQVLGDLIKADIIYKGVNSKGIQYFVNPWIYCKGVRINAVLKTMFKNYHIRVLGGKQWGRLGDTDIDTQSLVERAKQAIKNNDLGKVDE